MLKAWSKGDGAHADDVFPLLYDELRKRAHSFLRRERPGHTLQTTALINETYIRLREQRGVEWESRAHFFAICATMMRRILVDYAKKRNRAKRGGLAEHVPIEGLELAIKERNDVDVIKLNEALNRLAQLDPQQVSIVELKYFSGLTIDEIAGVLQISDSTVKREWRAAKAWLRNEMSN